MKYNLLQNAVISNLTTTGTIVNSEQLYGLFSGAASLTVTGATTISLLCDLGYVTSVEECEIQGTNLPNNLSIYYGQTINDLVSGTLTFGSNVASLTPTGNYSPPRYFRIDLNAPTSQVITISGLSVVNTDAEVDFGYDGETQTVTINQTPNTQYSDIIELPLYNDTTLPGDMYSQIDTFGLTADEVSRFYIGTSSSGEFNSTDITREVPTSIPWEWGIFSDTTINDNKLVLNTLGYKTQEYQLYTYYSLPGITSTNNGNQPIEITLPDGNTSVVVVDNNNNLVFVDPITGIRTVTTGVAVPADAYSRRCQSLAWDGGDRIYYVNNAADRTIRYYKISTGTHFSLGTWTTALYARAGRWIAYHNGILYIGGLTTGSTSGSTGNGVISYNISTSAEVVLNIQPFTVGSNYLYNVLCCVAGNLIFVSAYYSGSNRILASYNTSSGLWSFLGHWSGSVSSVSNIEALFYVSNHNAIYLCYQEATGAGRLLVRYNLATQSYDEQAYYTNIFNNTSVSITDVGVIICRNGTLLLMQRYGTTGSDAGLRILNKPYIETKLTSTISGYYLSPVFNLDLGDKRLNFLLDYAVGSGAKISSNASFVNYNYQVRGSDISPAADSLLEQFDILDEDSYYLTSLASTDISVLDNQLVFNHDYIDSTSTPYNAAALVLGLPLNTLGVMQYKFWWNPLSGKTSNTNVTKFYIAPYVDFFASAVYPNRSPSTLARIDNNYIYLQLGANTDTTTFSSLVVFNGATTTSHAISARSGSFYEVNWVINWSTYTYQLYFDSRLVGTGSLNSTRVGLLKPNHAFEIFSANVGADGEERFKELVISRIGNQVLDDVAAVPVHISDPLFGISGSLGWNTVSVNNPILPLTKYCQFKVAMSSSIFIDDVKVNSVLFPTVVKLPDVPVSGTKSLFLKYQFPEYTNLWTKIVKLKTWMLGDK